MLPDRDAGQMEAHAWGCTMRKEHWSLAGWMKWFHGGWEVFVGCGSKKRWGSNVTKTAAPSLPGWSSDLYENG